MFKNTLILFLIEIIIGAATIIDLENSRHVITNIIWFTVVAIIILIQIILNIKNETR